MILCLDVGNSHIFGGVFENDTLIFRFRYNTKVASTSDEIGLFLKGVLKENRINPDTLQHIAICSVVPQLDYSLRSACIKYFNQTPFLLQAGVKTGLKIRTQNPAEVGSDLIATAIAAVDRFPNQSVIVIDLGTATTIFATNAQKEFLGGAIFPGVKSSMEALESSTSKLSAVEILKPETVIGKNTTSCIQSGLYFSHLGTLKEITLRIMAEAFKTEKPVVIGTGGFVHLFQDEGCFDEVIPDLVLEGLKIALCKQIDAKLA